MAGLNTTLEIAKNTLLNSEALIQTSSHNISNADNRNYARQKAVISTNPPSRTAYGWLGMGARVTVVQQQRDALLERQLLNGSSDASSYKTLSSHLETIQAYFADDGENGISAALGNFWKAWEGLNQNPGTAERSIVYQSAKDLASSIVQVHQNLAGEVSDLSGEISNTVDEINGLLDKIYALNEDIVRSESPVVQANDLRDKRYEALKDLSSLISFHYSEESNGAVSIQLDGSSQLLSGQPPAVNKLILNAEDDGTFSIQTAQGKDLATYDVTPSTPLDRQVQYQASFSGKLKGLLDALGDADSYDDKLTTFKNALIEQVNRTYSNTSEGSPLPPSSDALPLIFFSDASNYMEVDQHWTVSSMDASHTGRALNMSELQDTQISALGGVRFTDYLKNMQQQIGLDQSHAISQSDLKEALTQQLEEQQQSVSGVSIDEEMIDILKNQQLYQAAAKMIEKTADMLNTVIQMV